MIVTLIATADPLTFATHWQEHVTMVTMLTFNQGHSLNGKANGDGVSTG